MTTRGVGRTSGWWALGFVAVALSGAGCASLEERDRLAMANRKLEASLTERETDLYDARAVADNLRNKLASLEGTLQDKDRLIDNVQGENERLRKEVEQSRALVEKVADKGVSPVVVLEKKLPPALDTALQEFARQHPGIVAYDDKRGVVKWVADVLFTSGSDEVKDTAKQSLRDFSTVLKSAAAADFEVAIVGHTDNVPVRREATLQIHRTNWHLSSHRAIAVSNVLLTDGGYDPTRVTVSGCSEFRPVLDNSGDANRAQNRRVDVYLIPRGSLFGTGTPEQTASATPNR